MKAEVLVYTDGAPGVPHGTIPQETIPMSSVLPFVLRISGPPESPCNQSNRQRGLPAGCWQLCKVIRV